MSRVLPLLPLVTVVVVRHAILGATKALPL